MRWNRNTLLRISFVRGLRKASRFIACLGFILFFMQGVFLPQGYAETLEPALSSSVTVDSPTPPPVILYTTPLTDEVGVKTSAVISATFDREMDSSTLTGSNFTVQRAGKENIPAQSITYDELTRTVTFTPYLQLQTSTPYKVTLNTEIKDKTGVPLDSNYEWSFTTHDVTEPPITSKSPEITYTNPVSEGMNIGLKSSITVHFNTMMEGTTLINGDTFRVALDEGANSTHLSGELKLSDDQLSLTFTLSPGTQLTANKRYKVTLIQGVKDLKGESLAQDYTWTFTTGNSEYSMPHGYYNDNPNSCTLCHQTHTAPGKALLIQSVQTNVCYTCHDGSGSPINVKGSMMEGVSSYHPISDTGNPVIQTTATLQCSSCHNPHGDKNPQDPSGGVFPNLLRVTDGANIVYSGAEYCITCHKVGSTYDKSAYKASYHYTLSNTPLNCSACHVPHASSYLRLQVNPEDTPDQNGQCLSCHGGSPPPDYLDAKNVKEDFLLTSKHTPLEVTGLHRDTETSESKLTNRHAECVDCHDPHSQSTTVKPGADLCLDCHNTNTYADLNGSDLYADLTDFSLEQKNLHNYHWNQISADISSGQLSGLNSNEICFTCHVAKPHGYARQDLLAFTSDNNPFSLKTKLYSISGLPNNWAKDTCATSCHGDPAPPPPTD